MLTIVPTMRDILNYALDKLDPAPSRAHLLNAGDDLAVYDCCDDGAVWVRLAGMRPSGSGPQSPVGQCPGGFIATLGVGAVRCVQAMQEDGDAPTPTTLTAEAEQAFADMIVLEQAIRCGVGRDARVGTVRWSPMTPEGGCGGGEWQADMICLPCGC